MYCDTRTDVHTYTQTRTLKKCIYIFMYIYIYIYLYIYIYIYNRRINYGNERGIIDFTIINMVHLTPMGITYYNASVSWCYMKVIYFVCRVNYYIF